jgi:O-antigen/teichoic acid export membrane protein
MAAPTQVLDSRTAVTSELNIAVKQSFVWGIGGVLIKAASFVMLPLYTHYLAPREYGIWELLDLLMSLLGMLLNIGLTTAVLKYYAAAETSEDRRRVISTSFVFALLTGSIVFTIGCAVIPVATHALFGPGVSSLYLFLSFGFAVMAYVAAVPYTLMRAQNRAELLVSYDTVGMVVMLALNIYFVVVLKLGVLGVLLSPLLVGTVKTIVLFYWTRHDIGLSIDPKRLRQLLVFGGPLVLSNLTMFALNFSDRFFLREFRSLEAVGIYAVGYKFGYMLNFLVIQPFNMMWQARMFVIHKQDDHQRIFRHMFVLYSLVLIGVGLGLALFGSTAIQILVDQRYVGATAIIPIVTLAYVFLGVGYFLQAGMFLASRTMLIGIVSAAAGIGNLILNYVLIRSFGMAGAAWATLLGFLILAVGSYIFSQRVCPLSLGLERMLKALFLAIGVYLLSQWLVVADWWAALLWRAASFCAFVALVWITGVLSSDEVATIVAVRQSAVRVTSRWLKPAWLGRT